MDKIFAVAGRPVFHSRSPVIFNSAFEALSINGIYIAMAASFAEEIIDTAREIGISGLNITSPFKEEIMQYLDRVDETAGKICAVNTVVNQGGLFTGYNTDFSGVKDALFHNDVTIKGKKAVVLGAGGASRAAVYALLSAGAEVTIVNRTFEKAAEIAEASGCSAVPLERIGNVLAGANILISSIPSGERIIEPAFLEKDLVILDGNYALSTQLQKDGKAKGCRIIDGREWLLFQALPAFTLFTGIKAPAEVMGRALYEERRPQKRNIALIGFMGTGKSTVAERLTQDMGMICVDVDKRIEEKAGCSIHEIFEREGENAFRSLERSEIAAIEGLSGAIISCGGGAVLNGQNRDSLKTHAVSVWLWAGVETIVERTQGSEERPLLKGDAPEAQIKGMVKERLPLYARTGEMLINTGKKTPEEIAERIRNEINNLVKN